MGRKRNCVVREFFNFDKTLNASVCKICSSKFVGDNVTNLKRHMTNSHFDAYKKEMEWQEASLSKKKYNNELEKQFNVIMSQQQIKEACLEFITTQAQPLSFFDSNAFKLITKPLFEGLEMEPITSLNICELLNTRYEEMKNHIVDVIKGSVFSIKMDSATRHNRSVLAINLQVIEKKRLVVYTLSCKEIQGSQSAAFLKEELYKVLNEFQLTPNQVYTITVDNGANMLKAVDLFSTDSNENIDSDDEGEGDSEDDDEDNDEDEEKDDQIITSEMYEGTPALSIRCAAHTLQLAVKDFLKECGKKAIIDRFRQVAKTLRTAKFRRTLKILKLPKPKIDVPTRWSSTYIMLQSLLPLKNVSSENLKSPTNEEWKSIEELVETLKPIYETTLFLQKEQLPLGDFYKCWLTLKALIKTKNTALSESLHSCIEKREPQLLDNDVLNAARFLDPRFRRTLNCNEKASAKKHLKELAAKLIALKQHNAFHTNVNLSQYESGSFDPKDESTNHSILSLLREPLTLLEVDTSEDESQNETCRETVSAYAEIDNYKPPREDVDIDLLSYWQANKYKTPFLKQLAFIIHAVPATQVSIARAFSALRMIWDDQRCNLSAEKLAPIMFVKLNQNSFK